ncbi:MAG: DUF4442 domain-containing protein [Bacteroidota bacterium]
MHVESWRSRLRRWAFNFFPAYRGTGARFAYLDDDWREVHIRLPLSWRTRNYVGSIFGGSMYAAVDPIYMVMLINVLGTEYVVWDKAATIRFRKPGRTTLHATFRLTDTDLDAIRDATASGEPYDATFTVDLVDGDGTVHAEVEKVIYIRRKKSEIGA